MAECLIIAEIGTNWTPSDLNSALKMIHVAAQAGADLAKFQDWHPLEQMNRSQEWKDRCVPWTLPPEWHETLRAEADRHGIGFMCSVFTVDALERALSLPTMLDLDALRRLRDVPRKTAVKLASSEIFNHGLLARLANRNPWMLRGDVPYPPVLLSLGEVNHANQVHTAIARLAHYRIVLMACIAEYPVKRPLDLLDSLLFAQTFGLPVGISSHVAYPDAAHIAGQAVRRGAVVVEAHLRAEGTLDDAPDNGPWALFPDEFAGLVEAVKDADKDIVC
jgi:N,N'-diacetyllegionaminate synthase